MNRLRGGSAVERLAEDGCEHAAAAR